jgi:hypothetical protein
MRNIQQLGVGQAEGQGIHRERQRRAFGERAIFTKFHNDGSSNSNMFEEKRNGHGDRGRSVVAVITFAPCTTDRSTPVRIARYQGNPKAINRSLAPPCRWLT